MTKALITFSWAWIALVGCAALGLRDRTPAEYAADALDAEATAQRGAIKARATAHQACALYESGLVSRVVPPDPKVSGRCAALGAR